MNTLPFNLKINESNTNVNALKALGEFCNLACGSDLKFGTAGMTKRAMITALKTVDWNLCDEDPVLVKQAINNATATPVIVTDLLNADQIQYFADLGIHTYISCPDDDMLLAYGKKIPKECRLESLLDVASDPNRIRQIKLAIRISNSKTSSMTSQKATATFSGRNDLHAATIGIDRIKLHKLQNPDLPVYKLSGKDFSSVINEADDLLGAASHLQYLLSSNGGPKNKIHQGALNWLRSTAEKTRNAWASASTLLTTHISAGCVAKGNQIIHSDSCADTDVTGLGVEAFFRTEAEDLLRALSFAAEVTISKTIVKRSDLSKVMGATKSSLWKPSKTSSKNSE